QASTDEFLSDFKRDRPRQFTTDCGLALGAKDTAMNTFHEWLAMREGLWLNDKNAVIGLSWLSPLPKCAAFNKSLAKGRAKAKAMPGVARAASGA
ncbi:MAG: hypothetical protein ACKO3P_08905, partial [Planctomycetaceae bacterium]